MESKQGQNNWFVALVLFEHYQPAHAAHNTFSLAFFFFTLSLLSTLLELYTLLLEDILVLLQKQDERLILKCHSKNLAGTADTKHIFSPIIKLNTVLVRSVATGKFTLFEIKSTF